MNKLTWDDKSWDSDEEYYMIKNMSDEEFKEYLKQFENGKKDWLCYDGPVELSERVKGMTDEELEKEYHRLFNK